MTKKEKKLVQSLVFSEGFDYAFRQYSAFDEVKDNEFHRLRTAYINAAAKLIEYTGCEE